jgi:hypothetical protein
MKLFCLSPVGTSIRQLFSTSNGTHLSYQYLKYQKNQSNRQTSKVRLFSYFLEVLAAPILIPYQTLPIIIKWKGGGQPKQNNNFIGWAIK